MEKIESYDDLLSAVSLGRYAWPGSYPVYFVTADYRPISYDAVVEEMERIQIGFEDGDPEWMVVGREINWENPDFYCSHTGKRIESAYAEEEVADG